jgi:4-hydroxy-tetrahydrodipicolinate reductase
MTLARAVTRLGWVTRHLKTQSMKVLRVLLIGAKGRMGKTIADLSKTESDVQIVAQCDLGDEIEPAMKSCDVVIDFSQADAIEEICRGALGHGRPLVIGTTGQSAAQRAIVEKAARTVPIVLASNFSIGVNTLFWLTGKAAELLGPQFDLEIVEMHHRMKKDAPSGTAKTLAEVLQKARKTEKLRYGREGNVGERDSSEIGIHAIRGGDVVGDHTVVFAGPGELLELTHRASSRDTFAKGALRAARWVIGQPAGLYSMQDVLGLGNL